MGVMLGGYEPNTLIQWRNHEVRCKFFDNDLQIKIVTGGML